MSGYERITEDEHAATATECVGCGAHASGAQDDGWTCEDCRKQPDEYGGPITPALLRDVVATLGVGYRASVVTSSDSGYSLLIYAPGFNIAYSEHASPTPADAIGKARMWVAQHIAARDALAREYGA